jgi:hypothetical protein
MAVPSPYVLAPAKLLNDDLLGSELVDDFPYDLRPVERRTADHRSAACARKQQNFGEDELVSGLPVAAIDSDSIAFSHTKLVAAVLNNCVHPLKLLGGAVLNDPLALMQSEPLPIPADEPLTDPSSSSHLFTVMISSRC